MGSVGIAVSRDEKTRDVVLAHVSDGLGVRYELVDHAFVATGRGRHGNWSGVMYALVRDRSTGELLMDLYLHLRARETQFRSSEVVIKSVSETSGPVEHCGVSMNRLASNDPGLVGLTLRAPARWWEAGLEVLTHDEAATT